MKPLEGLRVLVFEQFGAGPYGSMFLADLGAEVIKIENEATGGDASRQVGPYMLGPHDSEYFQSFNLNKKSVALDIKTQAGREAFLQLVAGSDAILNNLRGDIPEKLGIDYKSLREINPRVVCAHISAYGRGNSRESWPGYDFLMQAEAGLMSVTGEADGPPSRMGVSVIDYMTGMTGVVGLLSAVLRARQTGQGCDIDTCLFDVAMHQLAYAGIWYLNEGDAPRRLPRSAHASLAPVQTQRTADGWIFVMCMKDNLWEAFARGIGHAELIEDPRFSTQAGRRENRPALTTVLDEILSTRTTAEWLETLTGLAPVAPVFDVAQAFANPFVAETGLVREVPHPHRPDYKAIANPLRVDGERLEQHVCSPLGADNEIYLGSRPVVRAGAGERQPL